MSTSRHKPICLYSMVGQLQLKLSWMLYPLPFTPALSRRKRGGIYVIRHQSQSLAYIGLASNQAMYGCLQ